MWELTYRKGDTRAQNDSPAELNQRDTKATLGGLAVFFAVSCGALILSWRSNWELALLWAFAFDAVGALCGFLFGIPRIQQGDHTDSFNKQAKENTASAANNKEYYRLAINTNLEQVSDWLTKIIVGVGLVQLKSAPAAFERLSHFVGSSFSRDGANQPAADQHAGALIILFLVWGFVSGFLITRMYFTGAFARLDRSALGLENLPAAKTAIDAGIIASDIAGRNKPTLKLDSRQAADIEQRGLLVFERAGKPEVWAKVKLANREYGAAIEGYQAAIRMHPSDWLLRFEYATALFWSDPEHVDKRTVETARLQLQEALRLIGKEPNAREEDITRVYLSLGYVSLYVQPRGYETSIKVLEEFLKLPNTAKNARAEASFNLACAYAQLASELKREHKDTSEEFRTAAQNALDSLREAISLNPNYRERASQLARLSAGAAPGDDDFVVFQHEPEFVALVRSRNA